MNCGPMIRDCIRYEPLCKLILYSDNFYNFFRYVEVSKFDLASDAFATFKVQSAHNATWYAGTKIMVRRSYWQRTNNCAQNSWKQTMIKCLLTTQPFWIQPTTLLSVNHWRQAIHYCITHFISSYNVLFAAVGRAITGQVKFQHHD